MSDIYHDGTYLQNNPLYHTKDSPWKAAWIHQIIEKNSLDFSTLCEVGCGAGDVLKNLFELYGKDGSKCDRSFCGYDISQQAIELCSSKSREGLVYKQHDILSDSDAFFDIILLIDVIEHVEDYFNFIKNVKNKATYKIFHIPLDLSVQRVLRGAPLLKVRQQIGHLHYFTKDIALAMLSDLGLEIVDYFYTSGTLSLPRQGWKTKLLNIPRRIAYALDKDLTVRVFGGYSLLVLTV